MVLVEILDDGAREADVDVLEEPGRRIRRVLRPKHLKKRCQLVEEIVQPCCIPLCQACCDCLRVFA